MIKMKIIFTALILFLFCQCAENKSFQEAVNTSSARVIVSSDIGGTDPDDFQSMVHLLLYADVLDIEGLISSPFEDGRKEDILDVIDHYEVDYPNLKTWSEAYPAPDELRAITKQGALDYAGPAGVDKPTEGSEWIIQCARREDPRPLYVLVWGGIDDLAQALHDAPDILPKLRVYYIGGPNKKWGPGAYQYIASNHPELWIIESNATYRGWFTGGNQSGEQGNTSFVKNHIRGHGSLGDFFVSHLESMKMGDTPSVAHLLHGDPEDPSKPSWGGQYVRAWTRPYLQVDRMTTLSDSIEQFGVLEMVLPIGSANAKNLKATFNVDNQSLPGQISGGKIRFMFSAKSPKEFKFAIKSNDASLDGITGGITAYLPPEENRLHPDSGYPNWWTDDPARDMAEGDHIGARTVSRWREEFLKDFEMRMDRCIRRSDIPSE